MTAKMTVRQIATKHGLNETYANQLTLRKGFPDPDEIIGVNKMFDPRKVDKFFADREKLKHKRAS